MPCPDARWPCALYHETLSGAKRLLTDIFPTPLPFCIDCHILKLWKAVVFLKKSLTPEFPALFISAVPCFDKMHFPSGDEKLEVVTFRASNVNTLFFYPFWAPSSLLSWSYLCDLLLQSAEQKHSLTCICSISSLSFLHLLHQCQTPVNAQRMLCRLGPLF